MITNCTNVLMFVQVLICRELVAAKTYDHVILQIILDVEKHVLYR